MAAGTGPASQPASGAAISDLTELWNNLVEAAGRASPFVRSYLLEAHPVSFTNHVLTIGFDPEFEDHISLVDNARNHTLLQTKLAELGHPSAQFKFVRAAAPTPPVTEQPAKPAAVPSNSPTPSRPATGVVPAVNEKTASVPFSPDDFKNDPLIQKALEIFKGRIVEVRA
jgi:hypothetical protein